MASYRLNYDQFAKRLQKINRPEVAKEIQKLTKNKCPKLEPFGEFNSWSVEMIGSEVYAEDKMKLECRYETTRKHTESLDDSKVKDMWRKYSSKLADLAKRYKECKEE